MRVTIEIPYEFETDVENKFSDFFGRVIADINIGKTVCCGNFEKETAEMLLKAFEEGKYE